VAAASARPVLAVLAALAASAAGDGPLEAATGGLNESQRATLGAVLTAAAERATGEHDPNAQLLAAVDQSWRRHARLPELASAS
jgi:hypothetical protein